MTQLSPEAILEEIRKARAGGGSSTSSSTATKEADSWLATYTPTQLRYAYRAGLIDENEWQQELIARGETPTSARAEIEKQKATGLSTAASTRGQLTASEKAGVDAMTKTGAPPGRPQVLDSWESPSNAKKGVSTVDGAPLGQSAEGASSSAAVGPGGRTLAQVKGTEYVSDAERQWYLAETQKGGGTSTSKPALGTGGSSGGGSTSSGGGTKVAATKAALGAVTEDEIIAAGGKQVAPGVWQVNGVQYRKQTDGTYDVYGSVAAPPPKKLSPLEQAASSLNSARGLLDGGEQAAPASGQGASSPATAPASSEPRLMTANDPMVQGGVRLTGLDQPGYGTLNTVGTAGNNVTDILGAAHLKPTGDPQLDLRTVLGILGERELLTKQGMSPLEIQSMIDARADARARPNGGGYANFNTGFDGTKGNSTPTVNASGRIVIDDTPGHYRELLEPTVEDPYAYMANGTPDFNTPNPIAFVDMVTGKPIGMAGGTGRETISVDPDGPHGTPAQEAQVGSRMWPGLMGVKPYANGVDDIMQQFLSGEGQSDGGYISAGPSSFTPDYSSMNGGRDPDYISASMMEPGGVSFPSGESQRGLSPDQIYKEKVARGWAGPSQSTFRDEPETNDDWLRYVQTHLNDPLTKLPARLLPSQFLQDPQITKARDIARRPWYYGLNDSFMPMASGGSGFAGHPGSADGGMFSNLEKVFRFGDLENAGVYAAASRNWEGLTPNMQNNLWSTMGFAGMGTPTGGNHSLPAVSYAGLSNPMFADRTGSLPMASLYNTNMAQLPWDVSRELGNQVNPNAAYSLGLQAPMTQAQIMRTPISKLRGDGYGGGGLVTTAMADGGMGMAGDPMMADPMMMEPPQTPFSMLLETLLAPRNKGGRKPPLRPVGATMGVAA